MYSLKLSILLFMICISANSFSQTIVAAIGDYPPYTSKDDPKARLAEEIVTEAFKAVGYQVEIRWVPWKRAYEEARLGKVDFTFAWFKTKTREADFYYSLPLYPVQEVFFFIKGSQFSWSSFEDLSSYRIGSTLGYSHIEVLNNAGVEVELAKTDTIALQKLYNRRIDATPIDVHAAYYLLSRLPQKYRDAITHSDKPVLENHQYVLASKKLGEQSERLIAQFNQGLSENSKKMGVMKKS